MTPKHRTITTSDVISGNTAVTLKEILYESLAKNMTSFIVRISKKNHSYR